MFWFPNFTWRAKPAGKSFGMQILVGSCLPGVLPSSPFPSGCATSQQGLLSERSSSENCASSQALGSPEAQTNICHVSSASTSTPVPAPRPSTAQQISLCLGNQLLSPQDFLFFPLNICTGLYFFSGSLFNKLSFFSIFFIAL